MRAAAPAASRDIPRLPFARPPPGPGMDGGRLRRLGDSGCRPEHLVRHPAGPRKISRKPEHAYIAIVVGVVVSGWVGDMLASAAALLFGGYSVRALLPSYILSYAVLLWLIALTLKALDGQSGEVDDGPGPAR